MTGSGVRSNVRSEKVCKESKRVLWFVRKNSTVRTCVCVSMTVSRCHLSVYDRIFTVL
jgi:hypothetical protein